MRSTPSIILFDIVLIIFQTNVYKCAIYIILFYHEIENFPYGSLEACHLVSPVSFPIAL